MNSRGGILRWSVLGMLVALLGGTLVFAGSLGAQGTPTLTIVSPADGTAVDEPVTVRIQHSGIVFDGVKIGQAPEPGVGHWHVNIDGQYAGLAVSNVLEIPNDAFPTISAGEHTITVDLHQNNHAATEPPVAQTIKLNFSKDVTIAPATGGSPSIRLVEPAGGADAGAPIVVRIEHSGIVFDGVKIGQAPEPGVGHWHVNIDGQYAGLAVSNVLEIPNDAFPTISAGEHTITVDLHQNNHAATNPPAEESFRINLSQDLTLGTGSSQGVSSSGPVDNQHAATATATGLSTRPLLPNTGAGSAGLGGMGWLTMLTLSGVLLLLGSALVMSRRTTRGHSGRQH